MPKTRILLADDHAIVRAGIRKVVEDLPNIEVVAEVGDGLALLEALSRTRPDCLLIDVRMPNFEPVSAIRQIRAGDPDVKILVVSAFNDDVYVQGLFGAGVDGYHLKDQPLSDLKLALERVLLGERWISGPLINKLVAPDLPSPGPALLTLRQKDILRLLQAGLDNQAIAAEMGLSIKTVENHLTRLYRQLRVQSRLEAVAYVNQRPEVLGVSGQAAALDPDVEPPAGAGEGGAILMVDDNVRYLRQLRRVLGKVCPEAVLYEAETIAAAVQIAQRIHPRLALVDVVLGEEDGIRCARRVKAISPGTRIVTISAYPDREFHRLSLEAGAVAFLDKKDLDAVTLEQVIQDIGL
jgi:DNA-binding NarL/FixJ family response regulator